MQRRIATFHQDEIGDWVADLECGHAQHVRHDPPWRERPWITDATTRERAIGTMLECRKCDEEV